MASTYQESPSAVAGNIKYLALAQAVIAFLGSVAGFAEYNVAVFAVCLWSLYHRGDAEPMVLAIGGLAVSAITDIIFLSKFGEMIFKFKAMDTIGEFAAVMVIINLIIKPAHAWFLYNEYKLRGQTGEQQPYASPSTKRAASSTVPIPPAVAQAQYSQEYYSSAEESAPGHYRATGV